MTSVLKDSPHNEEARNGLLALDLGKDQLDPPKAEVDSVIELIQQRSDAGSTRYR